MVLTNISECAMVNIDYAKPSKNKEEAMNKSQETDIYTDPEVMGALEAFLAQTEREKQPEKIPFLQRLIKFWRPANA